MFSCFLSIGVSSFERLEDSVSHSNHAITVVSSISFTSGISISDVIGLEIFGVPGQITLDGSSSNDRMFSIANSAVIFRNLTFENGKVRALFQSAFRNRNLRVFFLHDYKETAPRQDFDVRIKPNWTQKATNFFSCISLIKKITHR